MKNFISEDVIPVLLIPSPITGKNFYLMLEKLGFKEFHLNNGTLMNIERQAEALFKIFYMAGYLEPQRLWQDINHIPSIEDKKQIFISLATAITKANGYKGEYGKFNSEALIKELGNVHLSVDNWADLLLYISQNAFNRKLNQERNELIKEDWMGFYAKEYMEEAKALGLTEEKKPTAIKYEEAWLAGASRVGILARLHYYKYLLDSSKIEIINHEVQVLAGHRELWANIDGLSPLAKKVLETTNIININEIDMSVPAGDYRDVTLEGKEYMFTLARDKGIKLDDQQSFIEYLKDDQNIPKGRAAGRTYVNYAKEETKKLTESLLAQDILNKYFKSESNIIDTAGSVPGSYSATDTRSNTYSTGLDAANNLVDRILAANSDQREYYILYVSNNPYIERQALATQLVVNKVLKTKGLDELGYKIIIEGVGFSHKQDVVTIHSELAALNSEKWRYYHQDWTEDQLGILKDLMFQTRDNSYFNEEMPKFDVEVEIVGNV